MSEKDCPHCGEAWTTHEGAVYTSPPAHPIAVHSVVKQRECKLTTQEAEEWFKANGPS